MGGSQPFMLVQMAMAKAEAMTRAERWQVALDAYAEAIRLVGNDGLGLATKTDAHRGAGIVQMRCSNWDGAENELLKSQALASELKDDRRLALAKNVRAAVAFERGDWPDAHKLYAAAREHADASGSTRLLAQIDNNQGALWSAVGHQKWAETCFRRALELFDELDNHPCGARTLNNLGIALVAQGRLWEADNVYDRAMRECKRQGDRTLAAEVMLNRADLAYTRGNDHQAQSLADRARAFAERLENVVVQASALRILGGVARVAGDLELAKQRIETAIQLSERGTAPLSEAEAWAELGQLFIDRYDTERAEHAWRRAQAIYRHLGNTIEADRLDQRINSTKQLAEAAA
jgi:tetratricopeptide (TPR) repeat protein